MKIKIRKGETFDDLFRRFRSDYKKSGIQGELKKRRYFMNKREMREFKEKQNRKYRKKRKK